MRRFIAAVAFVVAAVIVSLVPIRPLPAQQKAAPPAVPATYPSLTTPTHLGAKPGTTADLILTGTNLTDVTGIWLSFGGTITIPDGQKDATKLAVKIAVPADAKLGTYALRVATKAGISNARPITLDEFPQVPEVDSNRAKTTPQVVPNPCVVTGTSTSEAADFFRFPVKAGEPVTVEVLGRRLGSPIDPVVILSDANGRELGGVYADDTPGLQTDARVTYVPKVSGELIAEVRDTTYRGGADYAYRLRIGNFPGATTAFPLAVQRGKSAEVGFSGPGLDGVLPVAVKAPTDPAVAVVAIAPKRASGTTGWPVPVKVSDMPEAVEQEPNDDPARANKIPVPGGVSARFDKKSDLDHFKFTAIKGTKYIVTADAFDFNAPTEVYLRVLDAKGGELAKSNSQQPTARVEVTAAADGDLVIACEHLNYLAGPNEVYHLTVTTAAPDFAVTLGLDRLDVPAGGVGLLPITGLAKLNGFNAAVDFTFVGEGVSGTLTLPAAANPQPTAAVYLPLTIKAGTKPGPVVGYVRATAKIDGVEVTRIGSTVELVRAAMSGLPNPPTERTNEVAVAIVPESPYTLTIAFEKPEIVVGGTLKGKVTVKRSKDATEEIAIAALIAPANVTFKLVPVKKGESEGVVELTVAAGAAVGPMPLLFRSTTKIGGKDSAVAAMPVTVTVQAPPAKKEEPKKDEPKKK